MTTLASDELVKIYRRRRVVNGVSIAVSAGEIVGLLGPNGAGKTTSFYMITGLIKPNGGRVLFDDEDITKLPMYSRARKGIGYLPQEPSIFRKLSVKDNILAILEYLPITKVERKQRLEKLMSDLDVEHIADSKGYNLSGGERRRVEIARALVTEPKFILLDEPFSGIDPITVEEIQKIIHRLKDKGLGILVTDHNVRETLSITDRAYIIYEGNILKSGSADFLANDPETREIYLGEKFRLN
ncbi:MAG: LPS export ABC transporter ATP-binding protein [candidate division Zixibacteria bacterium]|nr:LPS export ABC transporter ATP-binding protein [candidate division Zixibacteria bacterium]